MLTHWNKLLTADCKVVKVKDKFVYPIFRVGSTSILHSANETYVNEEIAKCDNILILLRDPGERFVSGLNEFCLQNKLDVNDTWQTVKQGKLIDRHFAPQYIWLLHLSKFYNGKVTLMSFDHIKNITQTHKRKKVKPRIHVNPLQKFVEIDKLLINLTGQTLQLRPLIKRFKNVLS